MYKILIVEDEELERTSMKIFLEENLLDVEIVGEAKSGFEAVEMIDSKDINLLLFLLLFRNPVVSLLHFLYSCTNGTFIVTFIPIEGLFSLSITRAYSFPK